MNPPSPQSKPTHKPLAYLRHADANLLGYRLLAYVMALIGGAINAGGFFAVARYTSHMSGELARMADHLYMHEWRVAWVSAVVAIVAVPGAAVCAWLAGLMITSPPRVGAVGAGWVAALVAWEVLLARG